jgi:selenocysteine lyase/cysteine desulfurase
MSLDVARIRAEFPSLAITDSGRPRVYFDSPGGTQTPKAVIDRTIDCLVNCNANLGGPFVTSQAAGRLVDEAHAAMADLLGAASPVEIVFGQNMTTLTFHISRSIARNLEPGDEIIVTRMDHDANIAPWLLVARDRGCRCAGSISIAGASSSIRRNWTGCSASAAGSSPSTMRAMRPARSTM